MKIRYLGCFSFSGLIATFVTLLIIGGVSLAQGGMLFSPGNLNAQAGQQRLGGVLSHAEIGGKCKACHASPWSGKKMVDLCVDCHINLVEDPDNFHRVMLAQGQATTCRECHPEHRGGDAALLSMDLAAFPHDAVGYSLKAHQELSNGEPFTCANCHEQEYASFDQARCMLCHQQAQENFMEKHVAAYGQACLDCHDGVDRFQKGFDHSKLAFPLEGKHINLTCDQCHRGARMVADFKDATQVCSGCHQKDDIHQGRLGQDCQACHTPAGWNQAAFDHSKSAFPLQGQHIRLTCNACHLPGVDGNTIYQGTPITCYACHAQDDAHQGQYGQECEACHTPESWDRVTFNHARTAFPLTGAHLQVQCTQCHVNQVFKGLSIECVSCHAEPAFHQALFQSACNTCHTTTAWLPAQYSGAHRFPMSHGGANSCRSCHPDRLAAYTCYTCHDQTETDEEHREEGITNLQDCVRCHPTGEED